MESGYFIACSDPSLLAPKSHIYIATLHNTVSLLNSVMVESYGHCIHTQVDINRAASPQVRGAETWLPVPGARWIGRALFMMIKVLA